MNENELQEDLKVIAQSWWKRHLVLIVLRVILVLDKLHVFDLWNHPTGGALP